MMRVKRGFYDDLGMILGGRDPLGHVRTFGDLLLVAQKLINVGNTDAGTDALDPDVAETRQ
jgi:hypothetical protein